MPVVRTPFAARTDRDHCPTSTFSITIYFDSNETRSYVNSPLLSTRQEYYISLMCTGFWCGSGAALGHQIEKSNFAELYRLVRRTAFFVEYGKRESMNGIEERWLHVIIILYKKKFDGRHGIAIDIRLGGCFMAVLLRQETHETSRNIAPKCNARCTRCQPRVLAVRLRHHAVAG